MTKTIEQVHRDLLDRNGQELHGSASAQTVHDLLHIVETQQVRIEQLERDAGRSPYAPPPLPLERR